MAVRHTFKNNLESGWTQIPNTLINDRELSWKAKGVFCYLASKRSDWEFYISEIKENATDGRTSLQTALSELEDTGWLIRRRQHGDGGQFEGMLWILKEPSGKKTIERDNHQTENPSDGESVTNNTNNSNTNINNTTTNTEDDVDYQFWVDKWNEINDAQCRVTDKKRKHIRARLDTWSKDELIEAMKNRAKDSWINNEGLEYKTKFISFWRNDEKVETWLNRDPKQKQKQQTNLYGKL